MHKTYCRHCGDTGIVMHRTAVQLEAGGSAGTVYFEDVEADCSYCSEARRLDRLEVQVDELIGTVRMITQKLADALDIELNNFPRSTAPCDEEIPF